MLPPAPTRPPCWSSISSAASTSRAGAGATTRPWSSVPPRCCARGARPGAPVRAREAHVDGTVVAAAARSARERVQARDGSARGRGGDREARQQRLHRDVARGAIFGAPAAAALVDRGAHHESLRLDHRAHGRQPGLHDLGRVRRHRHLRSRWARWRRTSRRADSRDRAVGPSRRVRYRGRHWRP